MRGLRLVLLESFEEDVKATARVLALEPGLNVVSSATEFDALGPLVEAHRPDLVLVDLALLGRGSRRQSIAQWVARGVRLVILTDQVDASSPTARSEAARALLEGALDVLFRPPCGGGAEAEAARHAFHAQLVALGRAAHRPRPASSLAPALAPQGGGERVVVVGVIASTGGPTALAELLAAPLVPPVLVALHMPAGFARGIVRTLRQVTKRDVMLAEKGARAEPGRIYLAPDGADLGVSRELRLTIGLRTNKPPHPSGSVLLGDLAAFGKSAVGVVLTGMGDDGLVGARLLRAAGGRLLAQDRASCVVFGMPGVVVAEGLAEQVLPPRELARQLREWTT